MSEFNQYGCPVKDGVLDRTSDKIANLAKECYEQMEAAGATVVELRAAVSQLSWAAEADASHVIMTRQARMREAERNDRRLFTVTVTPDGTTDYSGASHMAADVELIRIGLQSVPGYKLHVFDTDAEALAFIHANGIRVVN